MDLVIKLLIGSSVLAGALFGVFLVVLSMIFYPVVVFGIVGLALFLVLAYAIGDDIT